VAPTRQPQAAAQARGTGRLGLKRTLGRAVGGKGKGELGCLRRGKEKVEGPPSDFTGLG
jgi:hypothetical protein